MDPRHPESESPPPRSGRVSDTEPSPPAESIGEALRRSAAVDEFDPRLDTIPAPGCEERDTMPPADPPADLATWERGLDLRFDDIRRHLMGEQESFEGRMAERLGNVQSEVLRSIDELTGAIRHLADETARYHQLAREVTMLRADVTRLESRCPHCSTAPPDGNGALPPQG